MFVLCAAAGELHPGQHEAGPGPDPADRCAQPHGHHDRDRDEPAESDRGADQETDQRGDAGEAAGHTARGKTRKHAWTPVCLTGA